MNRDPRYRARLNQISSTLETANLNTQASLWSIKESYLGPCLTSVSDCLESACYPCYGARRERARARQRRSAATARGRPEFVFDFYNDEWDTEGEGEDERSGLLGGWGADELDRLLAGSGTGTGSVNAAADGDDRRQRQPKLAPGMNYGATSVSARRRRSTLLAAQGSDPTILPGSSMFGFLERLPWKIGGRGVKYKPSAADLQENPGAPRKRGGHGQKDSKGDIEHEIGNPEETSALLEDDEDHSENERNGHHKSNQNQTHRRNRSDTTASRSTQNSLSSRGDLLPSEDEAADAVPLDDSFALSFAHRSSDGEIDSQSHTALEETTENDSQSATTSSSQRRKTQAPSSNRPKKPSLSKRTRSNQSDHRPHLPSQKSANSQRNSRSIPRTSSTQSEMALHATLSPVNPSTGTIGAVSARPHHEETPSDANDVTRSIWSDHENEADESALVSPVAERADGTVPQDPLAQHLPSLEEIAREDEAARLEHEDLVRTKRALARKVAREKGLDVTDQDSQHDGEDVVIDERSAIADGEVNNSDEDPDRPKPEGED